MGYINYRNYRGNSLQNFYQPNSKICKQRTYFWKSIRKENSASKFNYSYSLYQT